MRNSIVVLALTACGRIGFDGRADAGADARADMAACVPSGGLVGCWSFDGDTADSSSAANHASGTIAFTAGRDGGRAALFDAMTDLRVADSPTLHVGAALTVAAWVRIDMLPGNGVRSVIVDRNDGFAFGVRDQGTLFLNLSLTVTNAQTRSSMTLPAGTWLHVAGTYGSGTARVYIAGLPSASASGAGTITSTDTSGTRIGGNLIDAQSSDDEPWLGAIDSLAIWNRVLEPSEICALAGTC